MEVTKVVNGSPQGQWVVQSVGGVAVRACQQLVVVVGKDDADGEARRVRATSRLPAEIFVRLGLVVHLLRHAHTFLVLHLLVVCKALGS